jgi:hypothetical protein
MKYLAVFVLLIVSSLIQIYQTDCCRGFGPGQKHKGHVLERTRSYFINSFVLAFIYLLILAFIHSF